MTRIGRVLLVSLPTGALLALFVCVVEATRVSQPISVARFAELALQYFLFVAFPLTTALLLGLWRPGLGRRRRWARVALGAGIAALLVPLIIDFWMAVVFGSDLVRTSMEVGRHRHYVQLVVANWLVWLPALPVFFAAGLAAFRALDRIAARAPKTLQSG